MAQRVVEIRLAEPKFDGGWEERTRQFIEDNRDAIIGDLVAFFQREPKPLKRLTRWATWESQVLARVDDPNGCLDLIVNRRDAADVEHEEGEIIEDFFAQRLRGLGYDVDRADMFIPADVAARWYNRATGDNRKVSGVTRTLKQLHDERTIWRIVPARQGGTGCRGVPLGGRARRHFRTNRQRPAPPAGRAAKRGRASNWATVGRYGLLKTPLVTLVTLSTHC